MNTTIRTLINLESAGTSEGAKKGWEERGYNQDETKPFKDSPKLPKGKDNDEGPAGPPFFGTKPNIKAWGTSQGVKKEWETRHGGQMKQEQMNKSRPDWPGKCPNCGSKRTKWFGVTNVAQCKSCGNSGSVKF